MTDTTHWDVFISHASEDKDQLVRPLAEELKRQGLRVWYDEHVLTLGDSLRRRIDDGLSNSRFGVVVLSRSFFAKSWPQNELDGLLARERPERKVILPIWHNVSKDDVAIFSPMLAGKLAFSSDKGIPLVAQEILKAVKASPSTHPDTTIKLANLNNVPDLPMNFVPRNEDLDLVKEKLFDLGKGVAVTGKGRLGVQGMGGLGKSVLAAAIAHDIDVRQRFHDGILWITIGQDPGDLTPQQAQIAEFFSGRREHFENQQHGKSVLQEQIRNKACLLILDDVWDVGHAKPFDVLGHEGRILVTTRQRSVLDRFGAKSFTLNVLPQAQALELLASWAGQALEDLPRVARDVVRECDYLPLALAMVGAMVKCNENAWSNALQKLRNADFQRLRTLFPDYPYDNLLAALQVSVDALNNLTGKRYIELSVFPQDLEIPTAAIAVLWKLDLSNADDVLNELADRSLLSRRLHDGCVTLHDLQGDYIRKQSGEPKQYHSNLISNYKTLCRTDWHTGPNDGYFFERLPFHFNKAGDSSELKRILLDPQWIQAKLRVTGPYSLIRDYRLLDQDSSLSLIGSTIALASNSLLKYVQLFPTEFWGRLVSRKEATIQKLLSDIVRVKNEPWLRPITHNLTGPGGPLIATLYGHSTAVTAICCTSDGKTLISGGSDGEIKLWSVESGELLKTLCQHKDSITNVTTTPDNEFILTASKDGLIIVWDQHSGNIEKTLQRHNAKVNALTISPDGRYAISSISAFSASSSSDDHSVVVWNIDSGQPILIFSDHSALVTAVAIAPNNEYVISAALDATIKIWSLKTGCIEKTIESKSKPFITAMVVTSDNKSIIYSSKDDNLHILHVESEEEKLIFSEHKAPVNSLVILREGSQVVSGASDKTIRLWSIQSGKQKKLFIGHQASVTSVATIPTENIVISASDDKTLKLWAINAESSVQKPHHDSRISHIASSTKNNLAVTASTDKTIKVWDTKSGTVLRTIKFGTFIDELKVIKGGEEIVVFPKAPHHGNLYLWSIDNADMRDTISLSRDFIPREITSDGRTLFSSCREGFVVLDTPTREVLMLLHGERNINIVTFSTNGRNFATASNNGISIWSLRLGGRSGLISSEKKATHLTASPVDGPLLSASRDGFVSIWDFETGNTQGRIKAHSEPIQDIAFTPSGQQIVSVSLDKTMKIWDIKSLSLVSLFQAEERLVSCAAVSEFNYVAGDRGGNLHFLKLEKGQS